MICISYQSPSYRLLSHWHETYDSKRQKNDESIVHILLKQNANHVDSSHNQTKHCKLTICETCNPEEDFKDHKNRETFSMNLVLNERKYKKHYKEAREDVEYKKFFMCDQK